MGAYLSRPVTEKESFSGECDGLEYAGCAMQGWRRHMEDAHIAAGGLSDAEPSLGVFGVFDGHGGGQVARFCQKHLTNQLAGMDTFPADIEASLINVFLRMDEMLQDSANHHELLTLRNKGFQEVLEAVHNGTTLLTSSNAPAEAVLRQLDLVKRLISRSYDQGREGNGYEGGQLNLESEPATNGRELHSRTDSCGWTTEDGCGPDCQCTFQAGATAVVAVKRGQELFVANAGDSRGVLCRGGLAVPLSQDHKPALESERSRIVAAGGFLSEVAGMCRVNGNLNVSRGIGDLKYKSNRTLGPGEQIISAEPEVRKFSLTPEDRFFVLACDGVWDVMENQDVVDYVVERMDAGEKLHDICSNLLDKCLAPDPKVTKGIGCDNMTILIVQLQ